VEELNAGDDIRFLGYVPAVDLPALYGAATAAVMPSVYEGFGLPVLEAMASGTPVISSDTSSLPELGGEAAFYFDPYDVEGMASAIRDVWTDADLRADMSQRGLEQASSFSWERAADETTRVYERTMGGVGSGQYV
jgi:glycosyltransferase involved in cell wall biosynthesis